MGVGNYSPQFVFGVLPDQNQSIDSTASISSSPGQFDDEKKEEKPAFHGPITVARYTKMTLRSNPWMSQWMQFGSNSGRMPLPLRACLLPCNFHDQYQIKWFLIHLLFRFYLTHGVSIVSKVISTFILRHCFRCRINKPIHYSRTFDHGFYQQC